LLPAGHNGSDIDLNAEKDIEQPLLDIKRFVDGRGLACPMPLLKTKVALRDIAVGESLYVVATDPNSQADITAFCRQSQQVQSADCLKLIINEVTDLSGDSTSLQRFATIYHFIITKTDSN
jgi:TusA-related sulfurtransferase